MHDPYLLCVKGEHRGVKFKLDKGLTKIGRADDNDIIISDAMVSRYHGEFSRDDQRITIKDKKSANGVFVNGVKVNDRLLFKNDIIDIGPLRFIFNADIDLKFAFGNGQPIYFTTSEQETVYISKMDELPPSRWDRESQKLLGFMKIFSNITSREGEEFDPDGLMNLVSQIKELFNADCAILMIWEEGFKALQPLISISDMSPIWTSKTLISKVFKEARSELTDCTLTVREIEDGDKNSDIPLERSCIGAPLLNHEKPYGVIYIHKCERGFYSVEDQIQFELLAQLLQIAVGYYRVMERYHNLEVEMQESEFVFFSEEMKSVVYLASKAAQVDSTILLLGETGVGKEVLAHYIHNKSNRVKGPFAVLNCASIPSELFESELFGHERGAFTGAVRQHKGKFEVAHGGTLFLDEIGELSHSMQAKLLRFLQDKIIYRVGGNAPIYADVRIIAATNRDLEVMVAEGKFREDLLYRLNVMQINIPPLRNRRSDIAPLIQYFFTRYQTEFNKQWVLGFSDESMVAMEQYNWPGNVRELENAIERAVLLTENKVIQSSELQFLNRRKNETKAGDEKTETNRVLKTDSERVISSGEIMTLKEWEKLHIEHILKMCEWNQQKAAQILGIHRNTLRNKINEYEIIQPSV